MDKIQGFRVQNHLVARRSTQSFILPRSIKWVPGVSGNLVVKSKLPPRSGFSLEEVEHYSIKRGHKAFFIQFSSWLSSFTRRVPSFSIKTFSQFLSVLMVLSLLSFVFCSCSMIVNFASVLKSWSLCAIYSNCT